MTEKREVEIIKAILLLEGVKGLEWKRLLKNYEKKLPYRVDALAKVMESWVYDLCPPGFEVDR